MSSQGVDGSSVGDARSTRGPVGPTVAGSARGRVSRWLRSPGPVARGGVVVTPRPDLAPTRLRLLEPVACLALAAHGVAVQMVATDHASPALMVAVLVLAVLGAAGLLGWRSPTATTVRLCTILALAFVLMAARTEGSGYVLLWHFVVAAVYPLVLPPVLSPWVAAAVPAGYLALVPFDAADGPLPVALLRAVALAVIAGFAASAADAFHAVVWDRDSALATLNTFVEATPVGLGYWDLALRTRWVNGTLARLSGRSTEELAGLPLARDSGLPSALAVNLHRAAVAGRPVDDVELDVDGRVWTSSYFPVRDGRRVLGVGSVVIDVTEQREAQRALAHSATHDALTGLPNRALFTDRLHVSLAQADRGGGQVAVVFCDLDRFKMVNDSLGHVAGDELLRAVGTRLGAVVRAGDTVARLGGDEFALLCTNVTGADEARAVAERVCAVMREPIPVGGRLITVTMSVGVAVCVSGERDVTGLLRDADLAMYQAKDRGRDQVAVFDAGQRHAAGERLEFHTALRAALDHHEIAVAYQPVLGLTRNGDGDAVLGLEALARWRRPGFGEVPPSAFIPTAEDLGLIHLLGEQVLRTAVADLVRWRQATGRALVVAVNMSALQLADTRNVELVERVLAESGLPASALQVEITESVLMLDVEQSLRRLADLRALGVTVAVDDFGTGYSSLAYLRDLPVDVLKIDRSFTAQLPGDRPLVELIVELARAIHAQTVVEGVETPEQLALIRELGCDQAQGFLLGRPLPPDEVTPFLVGHAHR